MQKQVTTSWLLLKYVFGLVPIVAGLDKLTNILVDWSQYASPWLRVLPISAHDLMMVAGVIEILAGILVLSKYTRLGAYLVSAWLVAIAVNLVTTGQYFDVAVRDVVMACGAFVLAKLTEARDA